jgi:hypothetical protein
MEMFCTIYGAGSFHYSYLQWSGLAGQRRAYQLPLSVKSNISQKFYFDKKKIKKPPKNIYACRVKVSKENRFFLNETSS